MGVIEVDAGTHQRLELLREAWGATSLDEAIRKLLDQVQPLPKSLFGTAPDLPPLTRGERDRIWEG